jgi:hypothetical protein
VAQALTWLVEAKTWLAAAQTKTSICLYRLKPVWRQR